jgi:hypothetical protein
VAGLPRQVPVQSWWRDAALVSGGQAGRDLRRAGALQRLPVIGQAVVDGLLTPAQAAVLCRLDGAIGAQDLHESQAALVTVAAGLTPEALGRFVSHLIATHCEPALEAEQAAARDRRHLQLTHEPDGTVRGRFVLAAEDAEAVLTVLEPLARKQGLADDRSAGQRRADAFVEVFAGAAGWMDLPTAGGQRPNVTLVINGEWASGSQPPSLAEELALAGRHPHALGSRCASGAWTGPQTRPRTEALLCDARLSRLILDSQGSVVALHSLTDQITVAQRKAVSARDRQCVAKGCTRPPAFCDVHHLEHREHGGATAVENMALLCRRHHVLWHLGAITYHDLHVPWLNPPPTPAEMRPLAHDVPPLLAVTGGGS